MQHPLKSESYAMSIILSVLIAICVLFVLLFPDQIFTASLQGLKLWWNFVFPAMLPYFILLHLLTSFGWLFQLGRVLDPIMKKVFHMPGSAGWAIVAGLAAGFPAGAQVVATLRSKRLLSSDQAERLLSLSFTSSPIIIVHIVAVGMYGDRRIGWSLLAIHWVSLAIASLIYSLRKSTALPKKESPVHQGDHPSDKVTDFTTSVHDGFGKLLGDAVSQSVQAVMKIGGIIMIFSVLVKACEISLFPLIAKESWVLANVFRPIFTAIAEVHLGSYAIYNQSTTLTMWSAITLSSLLAWGGLSGHVQIFGLLNQKDVRYFPFMYFRLLHVACAALITLIIWHPLMNMITRVVPASKDVGSSFIHSKPFIYTWWTSWTYLSFITGLLMLLFISASIILKWSRIKNK